MEVHQESLPKPHIVSFAFTMFIAIAVGVFGGVLTYAVRSQDRLVASMFLWLSLVLFLAAFWDLKFRTRIRAKRVVRELRSVYDRYHSGEQRFSFDREKFGHETRSGRYEAPWSGLLQGVERSSVITLSTKEHYLIVPKRVFAGNTTSAAAEQTGVQPLETLRQLILGPQGDAWPFHLGFTDYVFTEVPTLWRQHPFLMAEAHAGGLCLFLMIVYTMYNSTGPGVIWVWMVAAFFLFLTITTQFWHFLIKYRAESTRLRIE